MKESAELIDAYYDDLLRGCTDEPTALSIEAMRDAAHRNLTNQMMQTIRQF